MEDCADLCDRRRSPFLMIILSASQKVTVSSSPVRLQTNKGNPVSIDRCSHSPFGPCKPGPQEDGATIISAPFANKVLAILSVYASAHIIIPTFMPSKSIVQWMYLIDTSRLK